MKICRNGHTVPDDAAFCATCGDQVAATTEGSELHEDALVASGPRGSEGGPRWWKKRGALVAIGGGILTVALVIALIAAGGSDAKDSTDNPSADAPTDSATDSAHETCTNQLFAVVADLVDNGSQGLQTESDVNGVNDPFFTAARSLLGQFYSDRVQSGVNAAADALRGRASQVCSSTLSDQVRANYPEGGTYPGQ